MVARLTVSPLPRTPAQPGCSSPGECRWLGCWAGRRRCGGSTALSVPSRWLKCSQNGRCEMVGHVSAPSIFVVLLPPANKGYGRDNLISSVCLFVHSGFHVTITHDALGFIVQTPPGSAQVPQIWDLTEQLPPPPHPTPIGPHWLGTPC